jgi:hypothetical protein
VLALHSLAPLAMLASCVAAKVPPLPQPVARAVGCYQLHPVRFKQVPDSILLVRLDSIPGSDAAGQYVAPFPGVRHGLLDGFWETEAKGDSVVISALAFDLRRWIRYTLRYADDSLYGRAHIHSVGMPDVEVARAVARRVRCAGAPYPAPVSGGHRLLRIWSVQFQPVLTVSPLLKRPYRRRVARLPPQALPRTGHLRRGNTENDAFITPAY